VICEWRLGHQSQCDPAMPWLELINDVSQSSINIFGLIASASP
jgi:hypothetical protein